MSASDPANTNELTDEQLDTLLGSADRDLLRHVQANTDLTAALTRLLASGTEAGTGADPPTQADAARDTSQGHSQPTGPDHAFNELVDRYAPLVWSICSSYRLTRQESDDVSQAVFLQLVVNFESIRDPGALPGWLTVVTNRECNLVLRSKAQTDPARETSLGHSQPTVPHHAFNEQIHYQLAREIYAQHGLTLQEIHRLGLAVLQGSAAEEPGVEVMPVELLQAVSDGLAELHARDQSLLRLFVAESRKSYSEISALTGVPVGRIGLTLRRCLYRLRETDAMRAYWAATGIAGEGGGDDWRESQLAENIERIRDPGALPRWLTVVTNGNASHPPAQSALRMT